MRILVAALLVTVAASSASAAKSHHVRARFIGFVEGDYQYGVFCVSRDSFLVLGIGDVAAAYFAAAHPGSTLDVTYEKTPDADTANVPEFSWTGSSLNGYRSRVWWERTERLVGRERASRIFDALVESLMVRGDSLTCE